MKKIWTILFCLLTPAIACSATPFLPLGAPLAISLINQNPLSFPSQQSSASGTVYLSPNANGAAIFSATGPNRQRAEGEILTPRITLFNADRDRLPVNLFKLGGRFNNNNQFRLPRGSGNTTATNLRLGATLDLTATPSPGVYTGTATLKVFLINNPSDSAIVNFPVTVTVVPSIQLSLLQNMLFPGQMVGFTGNVTLNPNNSGAARFQVSGAAGDAARASVTSNTVWLTKAGTSQRIRVQRFRFGINRGTINSSNGKFRFPSGSGTETVEISIGARARYPNRAPAGRYTGIANFRVVYQ